jgi:hypothetical protein
LRELDLELLRLAGGQARPLFGERALAAGRAVGHVRPGLARPELEIAAGRENSLFGELLNGLLRNAQTIGELLLCRSIAGDLFLQDDESPVDSRVAAWHFQAVWPFELGESMILDDPPLDVREDLLGLCDRLPSFDDVFQLLLRESLDFDQRHYKAL